MERAKSTSVMPYVSTSVAAIGIAFFGWQLTSLKSSVVDGRNEVQALRAQIDAEREERAALEGRSRDLGRRAEELARSIADARSALASSGADVGASLKRME